MVGGSKTSTAHKTRARKGDQRAMTRDQVVAFIRLFERTTCHMLETLPEEARITLFLGEAHRIDRVQIIT